MAGTTKHPHGREQAPQRKEQRLSKPLSGAQMSLADESPEYAAFVEKFKPKKTTDDCYTPPEIYDAILGWAAERYGFDPACVVRPFWPDGDFMAFEYPDGCVVLDNPPFSILARICRTYITRGIRFFLFAPTMTILNCTGKKSVMDLNHIVTKCTITYENGATVPTSFITNLETDGTVLESAPDLSDLIQSKDDELQKANKKSLPKYVYPDHVITAARVNWFCAHHTPYKLNRRDCCHIGKLDAMDEKSIFGGGLLLSERAAAERAAAERAAAERAAAERAAAERAAAERAAAHKWELSPRELEMVRMIGEGATGRNDDEPR